MTKRQPAPAKARRKRMWAVKGWWPDDYQDHAGEAFFYTGTYTDRDAARAAMPHNAGYREKPVPVRIVEILPPRAKKARGP